jgi:transcriptional regulator with XRE-family HTH domain
MNTDLKYIVHPARFLEDFMKTNKISKKQLSKKLGIEIGYIKRVLKRDDLMSLEFMLKLEKEYYIPKNYFQKLQNFYIDQCKKLYYINPSE